MSGPDPKPVTEGGIGRPKPRARARTHRETWARLHSQKGGPCRLCGQSPYELHHLLSRARGGPDQAWNLVPLCRPCHELITNERPAALHELAASLTDSEHDGLTNFAGAGIMERLFRVTA